MELLLITYSRTSGVSVVCCIIGRATGSALHTITSTVLCLILLRTEL